MRLRLPSTLNTRIFIPLTAGLSLIVAGFLIVGVLSMREVRQQVEEERLVLADMAAERADAVLGDTRDMFRLMVAESDIKPAQLSEVNQEELAVIYRHFSGMLNFIMLTDSNGIVTGTYPFVEESIGADVSGDEHIQRVLAGQDWLFTNLFSPPGSDTPSAWLKLSMKDEQGAVEGVIFAKLNLADPRMADLMQPVGLGQTGFGELVDENGLVLASGRPDRTLQSSDCHGLFSQLVSEGESYVGDYEACEGDETDDLIAFAPLEVATWGVVIRQPKEDALVYSRFVRNRSLLVSLTASGVSLLLVVLVNKGFMKPVKALSSACEEIARGDLDRPLPFTGYEEIDDCVDCFESLRQRLKASVEEIETMNLELENKVALRTRELQEAEQTVKRLLHQVVAAQEVERGRIARELHDETSQSLTALAVMLNTVVLTPADSPEDVKQKLIPIREAATRILDEINRIILDLRPGILDDLGLMQAIDWYARSRLEKAGMHVDVWTVGRERHASAETEVMVFRIVQEAINNIVKHARATHASICMNYKGDAALLTIEDDGCGFDPEVATTNGTLKNHFGLLGMQERAALIGGELDLCAEPGQSVCIKLNIPYNGDASHA